jgi:4-diphosphocytidyl-2-C-methyl-D-erythritol kinase
LKYIIYLPVEKWQLVLQNDFEKLLFPRYPKIVEIKDELYRLGAAYSSMSGSGSTVFGLFPKKMSIPHRFPSHYFVRELTG